VVITITIIYEDGSEEILTIEVPQEDVEEIVNEYHKKLQ